MDINTSTLVNLKELDIDNTIVLHINRQPLVKLEKLNAGNSKIQSLDTLRFNRLKVLKICKTIFSYLNTVPLSNLEFLNVSNSKLTTLNTNHM